MWSNMRTTTIMLANKDILMPWFISYTRSLAFTARDWKRLAESMSMCKNPTHNHPKEGRQLVRSVNKTGVVLQLGTQQRSSEQFRKAAEWSGNVELEKSIPYEIGLPGDPSGPDAHRPCRFQKVWIMTCWLGSTPEVLTLRLAFILP